MPDFVILTADAYLDRERHLEERLFRALEQLENLTGQSLDSSEDPLVFALRCATPSYVPGVMPTYLNVGITENALPGLEKVFGAEPAQKMFLNSAIIPHEPDILRVGDHI